MELDWPIDDAGPPYISRLNSKSRTLQVKYYVSTMTSAEHTHRQHHDTRDRTGNVLNGFIRSRPSRCI